MNTDRLIKHLYEYFFSTADENDLDIVLTCLNENGSMGYFYYFTKQFEDKLAKDSEINEAKFQLTMTKWFSIALEDLTFILP